MRAVNRASAAGSNSRGIASNARSGSSGRAILGAERGESTAHELRRTFLGVPTDGTDQLGELGKCSHKLAESSHFHSLREGVWVLRPEIRGCIGHFPNAKSAEVRSVGQPKCCHNKHLTSAHPVPENPVRPRGCGGCVPYPIGTGIVSGA